MDGLAGRRSTPQTDSSILGAGRAAHSAGLARSEERPLRVHGHAHHIVIMTTKERLTARIQLLNCSRRGAGEQAEAGAAEEEQGQGQGRLAGRNSAAY